MSKYAHIIDSIVENIIACEDSNAPLLSGNYIKVTEIRGDAKIGGSYDSTKDKFIDPQPYASWTLDENDEWVSPNGQGYTDGQMWDEENQEWIVLIPGPAPE
jgi:hypothetical protein